MIFRRFYQRRIAALSVAVPAIWAKESLALETKESVTRYIELKDAELLTPARDGLQIVKMPDGALMRIDLERLELRDEQVFLHEAELAELALSPAFLGASLEVLRSDPVTMIEDRGSMGAIASALGSVVGTFAVLNTMGELSEDMINLSEQSLETLAASSSADDDSDDDPALDADEDEAADEPAGDAGEETEPEAPKNQPPEFGAAPTKGVVNESAAAGTSTGVEVTASDSDGGTLVYSIQTQQVEGAFAVDPTTGEIAVANSAVIDFEQHETLSLTVTVSDGQGGSVSQVVTIAIEDDDSDTVAATPAFTQAHSALSSGAIGFGNASFDPSTIAARFVLAGVEKETGTARVQQYEGVMAHFLGGADNALATAEAADFSALAEIDHIDLSAGNFFLGGYADPSIKALSFPAVLTDFGALSAFDMPKHYRSVYEDASGVSAASYALFEETIERTAPTSFATSDPVFEVGAGDILSFGDLTGDGEAEAIVLQADTAEAQVYENLGTGFATTPLEETILTGIDLNARAGGKVLDISVTDHLSNEGLNVVLLGETGTYFYELT